MSNLNCYRFHCNNNSNVIFSFNWHHVAYDPEHRLVINVVSGKRTEKNVAKLVRDFKKRTGGRMMNLITSDEYKPYKKAILKAYGKKMTPPHTGKPGRPKGSRRVEYITEALSSAGGVWFLIATTFH